MELLIELIEDFLKQFGITYKKHERPSLLLQRYFNFRLKYIVVGQRQIRLSSELQAKITAHPAKDAVFDLIYKTGKGLNLNPYQSKGAFNADVHDDLFNDWGIHHLHLSTRKKKPGDFFVERSDYLLFVRFTETIAYFLDMQLHKEKDVWSKKEFIRIIQRNWPESIADREMPGMVFDPNLNDNEIGILRKKGYLFGVNVDDKAYLFLGHGQASSGDNLMAGRMCNEVLRWMWANEDTYASDRRQFVLNLKEKLGL